MNTFPTIRHARATFFTILATVALLALGGIAAAPAQASLPSVPATSVECTDEGTYTATWIYPSTTDYDYVLYTHSVKVSTEYLTGAFEPTLGYDWDGTNYTVTVAGIPGFATNWISIFMQSTANGAILAPLAATLPGDCAPAPLVALSEWTTEAECEGGTVTSTRTVTTTAMVADIETLSWIPGEPVVTTETQSSIATAEDCPPVIVSSSGPAAKAPVVTLAATGVPAVVNIGVLALLLIAFGGGAVFARRATTRP